MSDTNGFGEGDRETMFRHLSEEYNRSLDRQHEAIERIQTKNLDLLKVNFLLVGALIAGASVFFRSDNVVLVTATGVSFILSTAALINGYSSRTFFKLGWGHEDIEVLKRCESLEQYYRITAESLDFWVGWNEVRFYQPFEDFRMGLWASFVGILCFSVVVIRTLVGPYPLVLDVVVVALCAGAGVYGWRATAQKSKPEFEPTPPSLSFGE